MGKELPLVPEKTATVTLLGGFSLSVDGKQLTDAINRSQKLWNVLCYLIVHRDRNIPLRELIELFWPPNRSSNPNNALKTLLYRIRVMLEDFFPNGLEPILSQKGSYCWNPAIECQVDAERFEKLCRKVHEPSLPNAQRLILFQEAASLYQGDYLPKLARNPWVISLSARYRALYLRMVKDYAALLEQEKRFERIEDICSKALQIDNLDEELYILSIRAMLHRGETAAALMQYQKATDLIYRSLGARPSEGLRDLYPKIMAVERRLEGDLETIQDELREAAAHPGAFVCEYSFFQEVYRLEARRTTRTGSCVHLALITVSQPDGGNPPLDLLSRTMDQLLDVLIHNLRQGDVISRYSASQYVIMLPAANFEDSAKAMERVISLFYHQHRRNFLKLSYRIRELD